MTMTDWKNRRILILGAARQGLALARYLCAQGAQVTLSDQRSPEQMREAVDSLSTLPLRWALGGHPLELLDDTDLVCVSGGVPLTIPLIVEALRRGIQLTNDSQIFMELVPCKVIAITGSAGKTTTTTLFGKIASLALPEKRVWVGGNIGLPLVEYLDEMTSQDLAVLELSSFQLELMTSSPQVAAVLNITPNHLDRHGTMAAYTAAKSRILAYQTALDASVLNREDQGSWDLRSLVKGKLYSFGMQRPASGQLGVWMDGSTLMVDEGHGAKPVLDRSLIELRGQHNLMNVLAASAVTAAAGLPFEAIPAAVKGFSGVAHRLEFVRTFKGAQWYNDSIATAPERTLAAIRSFNEPLVLLLGGRDKKLPWDDLAALIHQRVDRVVLFGECAEKIEAALGPQRSGQRPYNLVRCAHLHEAVVAAAEMVQPGDVVLLSPAATSFDEFKDFEERGERFREWVSQLS